MLLHHLSHNYFDQIEPYREWTEDIATVAAFEVEDE
jgi:hypothetical protein